MNDKEAMKLALEAMQYADACLKKQLTTKTKHEYAQDLLLEAGKALEEALKQEQGEPVAWRELCRRLYVELFHCNAQMTYGSRPKWKAGKEVLDVLADAKTALDDTTPQQPSTIVRTWVGLTYDERVSVLRGHENCSSRELCERIEAALKRKNNHDC